ncbi:unnamed protein product [Brassicogethes aeneus]|uniref:Uncharacterized protein n=1 Tax=Brassicogethes aeneus TaxID=1431903 RepID=A0A9P0AQ11_BRAAE|nr:unnamed protein product [Brassicogethes aeneus]
MFCKGVVLAVLFVGILTDLESNFYLEESCARKNGVCLLKSECPQTYMSEELDIACPQQKSMGAVCCQNYMGDLNCHQTHNECMKEALCPNNLRKGRKGCGHNETCCELV